MRFEPAGKAEPRGYRAGIRRTTWVSRVAEPQDGRPQQHRADGPAAAVTTQSAVRDDLHDADTAVILDRLAAQLGLQIACRYDGQRRLTTADGKPARAWREGYPHQDRLTRKRYEPVKRALQIELQKLQQSVKATGRRLLIVFEGRDAAGKGGTIRRFAENLHSRGARIVALDKPTEHEQGRNYLRRYLPHLPAPGEIALFDRSWYCRAGVEQVMGFCQPEEYQQFLRDAPAFEQMITDDGIELIKLWFSVTRAEQLRRLIDRHCDPVKCWKLSAVDLASQERWDEYTAAMEAIFRHTHLPHAPWTVVNSNDKRRARLESMRHVLSVLRYDEKWPDVVGCPDPLIVGSPTSMAPAQPALLLPFGLAEPGHVPRPAAIPGSNAGRLAT